jgi:Heparinase II/III-like protein/Heparinase II/III N-terminus
MPTKELRHTASKLAQMDWHELRDRGRQELSKRADAFLTRFDFAKGLVHFPNAKSGRFFFSPESIELVLETIRQRLPQQAERIIHQADKICRHHFDLLGFEDLDFGNPINWHLDPVHGKQAPKKASYKVRYLDFDQVGDSKVIWELNRHQHFVTLAKAYRLTDDRRFADELLQQWRHWHTENPYAIGINWASSLEVAFRSLSWIWMYQLLEGTSAMPQGFRQDWLRAQALSGRHIERYLSTYFSPNTHLLGEAVALFFLGVLCPELSRAEQWKSQGWEIILQEAQRQVQPDGFHFEQSTYYHVYALDFFLHAAVLASLNGIEIPSDFEKTLEKMLDALSLLSRCGAPPRFGDDDGGRLFDPQRNRSEHLLDPLATGAVLFHRGDFKSQARELREETIWLFGQQGVEEWDGLQEQRPNKSSAGLESVGLYMLGSERPARQLVIRAGPQGKRSGGHSHADALSICLQSQGRALVDPGTFTYAGEGSERDSFRGTAMHNTLRVDGGNQSETAGTFGWKQLTQAKAEQWISGETFDLFVGSHDGYSRLLSPVIHRRWVFSLKGGFYLVRDLAQGAGQHRLDISWHLGPEMRLRTEHVFGVKGGSAGLSILCPDKHGWAEEVRKDFWSPVYGKKEAITVLNFGTVADLPTEFVNLLIPLEETGEVPGKLIQITAALAPVKAYLYSTPSGETFFFFAEQNANEWSVGTIISDAEFVYWQRKREGGEQLVILCNGSYVEIEGNRIISCQRRIERCEVIIRDGHKEVHASDLEAV